MQLHTRLLASVVLILPLAGLANASPATDTYDPDACLPLSANSRSMSPPQLYRSMLNCLRDGQAAPVLPLYFLGTAYGSFDRARVADNTAHQARPALEMQLREALGEVEHDRFMGIITELSADAGKRAPLCQAVASIGPPTYHPSWMINHGMRQFTGSNEPDLVADFDPAAAWQAVLDNYLKCAVQAG
jgi:hypothetical protein